MKTGIKNELSAFKVPTPINKKIEKFAELEMISKSDLIRRSVFAEFSKLDEKYRDNRPTNWSKLKTA